MGESQKNVESFNGVLNSLGTTLLAVFSFAKIAQFFEQSLKAYAEEQLAIAKLVATLGAHGIASEALVDHLQQQAHALEALSGIEATNITNAQAMLVTYGLQGEILDKATKAAVDFTVRTGSLEVSTNLLTKAFEGNTTMLKRYGIVVDQSIDPAKQFESLLGQISTRFGPVAAAQVNTFSGQIAALSNSFHHLQEAVGQLLAGPGGGITGWLKNSIDDMTKIVQFLEKISDTTHSFTSVIQGIVIVTMQTVLSHMINILGVLVDIASHIPLLGQQFSGLKAQIDMMKMAVSALATTERSGFLQSVADQKVVLANEKAKQTAYTNTAQVHMDVSAAMNKWIQQQNMQTKDELLANLKEEDQGFTDFANTFITTEREIWGFAANMSNTFFQGMGDGFAKMVVEGKNFSDSMKTLFKDMAEQMISYIVQIIAKLIVMFALEQATGFGGFGGSVAASAFGPMASGGVIGEPSIILGLVSGKTNIAGEAGPEMVSPMNGGNSGGMGSGDSKAGSITINIQGQFLEADPSTWRQMVNQHVIPAIQRYTQINPSGPFNRSRGVI